MTQTLQKSSSIIAPFVSDPSRLLNAFLSRRSEATRRAYHADLSDFSVFLGVSGVTNALKTLLMQPSGSGNALVLEYKNHLLDSCHLETFSGEDEKG